MFEENTYGPEPTPTYAAFWGDAQNRLLLDRSINAFCPVRLIHGQCDPDVPWQLSLRLAGALLSGDIQVTLVKDCDHRLSRDADIALLLRTIESL